MPTQNSIPSWPDERDLSRYAEFTQIDFRQELSKAHRWMDIGCRTGKALSQSRALHTAELIGVNAHKIRVRKGIIPLLAKIPENNDVYTQYKRKVDLITDIHGAVSYAENPIEALIYEACLLRKNGKAVIVTMEHRMGSPTKRTWETIQLFFTSVMNQDIQFKRFTSYTHHTQEPIKTMRITITGHNYSRLSLSALFREAELCIGKMKKIKVIAGSVDQTAQIWRVNYK